MVAQSFDWHLLVVKMGDTSTNTVLGALLPYSFVFIKLLIIALKKIGNIQCQLIVMFAVSL